MVRKGPAVLIDPIDRRGGREARVYDGERLGDALRARSDGHNALAAVYSLLNALHALTQVLTTATFTPSTFTH